MNTPIVQPYLFFQGTCEEALRFYTSAIGAQVDCVMKYKDSPEPCTDQELPPGYEEKVMHASFRIGDSLIMASDGCGDAPAFGGFSLSLSVQTEEEARQRFDALSAEGEVTLPLGRTFWSPAFGMLKDRFGVHWMVMVAQDCQGENAGA